MIFLILSGVAAGMMGVAGMAALIMPRRGATRDRFFAATMGIAGAMGAVAALCSLVAGAEVVYQAEWFLPIGDLGVRLDALAGVFLVPIFLVPALGAIFGAAYWSEAEHPESAARLRVFYGLMPMGMAGVILAQNGVLLLMSWEVMAVAAFMAVCTQDTERPVREAGWVYFVATHVGTLALFAFFALLSSCTGSFDLAPIMPGAIGTAASAWLFVLALVGFGVKAGIMPLHVWLPGAHANAPSHVSAVLSGVMLKVGIYGIVRVCWMLPAAAWWGWLLMALGGVSAVAGIAFALGQRDYKRMLAYSSTENIGVIVLAIGAAMLGRSTGNDALAALAMAGALLHTWNHSLFKSSLFFVSGALLHATGTRRMNQLGGLAKLMPRTAAMALIACVAISALPPLNGFTGEWMIYSGMIGGLQEGTNVPPAPLVLGVVALSFAGALVLAAFVRFFGVVFLGEARGDAGALAHDPVAPMGAPVAVLVGLCVLIGVAPRLALEPIKRAVGDWNGAGGSGAMARASASLGTVSMIGAAATLAALVLIWWLRRKSEQARRLPVGTWDCGYARPSARMQYSESSFADPLVRLFKALLLPRERTTRVDGMFPSSAAYESETPDPVLDRGITPFAERTTRGLLGLRMLQRGRVQTYILYIFLGLLALLIFA